MFLSCGLVYKLFNSYTCFGSGYYYFLPSIWGLLTGNVPVEFLVLGLPGAQDVAERNSDLLNSEQN